MKKMNLFTGSRIARMAACAVCAAFIALAGCSGGSGGGSGSSDPWEEPESPGSPQNPDSPDNPTIPDNPDPEQPDNPNPDQPEEQKSISELLKELITNYDSLAGSSEITLSAQSIKAVGSVFFAESTVGKETIQNAIQDSETEAALVAQAEGNMKMQKSGAQYTFSKADCKLVFTGEFDIDETYLIIKDEFLDVNLSGAKITSSHSISLTEVNKLFIDFNPEITADNIIEKCSNNPKDDANPLYCPFLSELNTVQMDGEGDEMYFWIFFYYANANCSNKSFFATLVYESDSPLHQRTEFRLADDPGIKLPCLPLLFAGFFMPGGSLPRYRCPESSM